MFFSRDNPVPYGPNTQLVTWNEALTIGCSFSLVACYLYMFQVKWLIRKCLTKFFTSLTKYLSVATDTRMASSPVRTFSPSDLCLEDGWIVHQQASPSEDSWRPTSKASLSLPELLAKHARNWEKSKTLKHWKKLPDRSPLTVIENWLF